jgi:hypothetical protein
MKSNIKYAISISQFKSDYFHFIPWRNLFIFFLILIAPGCIRQFIPAVSQDQNLLVVEGTITDQPGMNTINISTSMPLGKRSQAKPLAGCNVYLTDDLGNKIMLSENTEGSYSCDPSFQGVVGRSYTIHVKTNSLNSELSYQSSPVLMRPVPDIDSVFWERVVFARDLYNWPIAEGAQIFLSTHDPLNSCRYYRWEYVETWEFTLPFYVANKTCWVTNKSNDINIKNTSSLADDRIEKFPINFITNATDRLKIKYSILVNQYALNEEEYAYWEKLRNTTQEVGGLYDLIPESIPSNITCIEKPDERVLGYFSVSSVKSKRIFIKSQFNGTANLYGDCVNALGSKTEIIPGLNDYVWIIGESLYGYTLTYFRGCADCTDRGSTAVPPFWYDSK